MLSYEIPIDPSHTVAAPYFESVKLPHELIPKIRDIAAALVRDGIDGYTVLRPGILAADNAIIHDSAVIMPPAVIGKGTEIRPGAYIRGGAIIGDSCVIGNSTEIKNSILFDGAKLPHYNYVGDSIIGHGAHLGAGAIISNLRLDGNGVIIKENGEKYDTGMRKMGAVVGDFSEIGCGSVICPGVIIGRRAVIYPLTAVTKNVPCGACFGRDGIIDFGGR